MQGRLGPEVPLLPGPRLARPACLSAARRRRAAGRCEKVRSWARAHGFTLNRVPEDQELLDQAIDEWGKEAQVAALGNEVGLFLGTLIIVGVAGARWRAWPNGHPVVHPGGQDQGDGGRRNT